MGRMTMKLTRRLLGHLLIRSLICSDRWLICLHRTARFTWARHCAHLLVRSLTHLLLRSWEWSYVHELNASIWYIFNPQCSVALCQTWKSVLIEPNSVLYSLWPLGLWNDSLKTALGLYLSLIRDIHDRRMHLFLSRWYRVFQKKVFRKLSLLERSGFLHCN